MNPAATQPWSQPPHAAQPAAQRCALVLGEAVDGVRGLRGWKDEALHHVPTAPELARVVTRRVTGDWMRLDVQRLVG